jgi:uncharacterized protein
MKTFLTAEWKNLINITYAVDPGMLLPHLPEGLELDLIDGKAFVSFVAFEFREVRVKGVKIPFHINFPEINLRFYVNRKGERGVVFIKEFVPKYFVALIARSFYNEPYHSIRMSSTNGSLLDVKWAEHKFRVKGISQDVSVMAGNKPFTPQKESLEHYFKEHGLGFGKDKKGKTLAYKVEHPVWEIYPVKEYKLNVDFGKMYGDKWKILNDTKPFNVMFAKGSEVLLFDKE